MSGARVTVPSVLVYRRVTRAQLVLPEEWKLAIRGLSDDRVLEAIAAAACYDDGPGVLKPVTCSRCGNVVQVLSVKEPQGDEVQGQAFETKTGNVAHTFKIRPLCSSTRKHLRTPVRIVVDFKVDGLPPAVSSPFIIVSKKNYSKTETQKQTEQSLVPATRPDGPPDFAWLGALTAAAGITLPVCPRMEPGSIFIDHPAAIVGQALGVPKSPTGMPFVGVFISVRVFRSTFSMNDMVPIAGVVNTLVPDAAFRWFPAHDGTVVTITMYGTLQQAMQSSLLLRPFNDSLAASGMLVALYCANSWDT